MVRKGRVISFDLFLGGGEVGCTEIPLNHPFPKGEVKREASATFRYSELFRLDDGGIILCKGRLRDDSLRR